MSPFDAVKAKLQAGEIMDWKMVWATSNDRSAKWARHVLWRLHKGGEIHIKHWKRFDLGPARPFFAWGAGIDAERPRNLTNAEVVKRYVSRLQEDNPQKLKAQKLRSNMKKRTTPILDPIHAMMLGYVRVRGVWVKPTKAANDKEPAHTDNKAA